MIKNIGIVALLLALFCHNLIQAQDLKCNISVASQSIQGTTNKKVFQTLQQALYEFMNTRPWTNHVFTINERIECNILINVQEQLSADEYRATIQVQSRRPVFNSSYTTVMLNYMDNNFNFRYTEFEPIELTENQHKSNLVAVLAFYANVIIGLDYDSYGLMGGTDYFNKAEKIVNLAQNSPDKGWKAFDAKNNKNRYWLVKNIIDKRYEPCREFWYKYHRLGLDLMDAKPTEGRAGIAEAFTYIQKVYRDKPDPFLHWLDVIFDAKGDEWVNVFSEGMPDEKSRVSQILMEINPAKSEKYKKINQQQ